MSIPSYFDCFFFQAEDGIRDIGVTGVQTCALPICTMDDKEYMLRTVREHFDAKRKELSRFDADGAALSRRVDDLDKRREGYWQLAADGDMPKVVMRKKVAEVEQELERVQEPLERARNREAELQRLDEAEKQIRQRIEAGYGGLVDMSPQERRKVYQDLRVRVKVGADKQPKIWGIFRTRWLPRTEGMDGQHIIYVVKADTSSGRSGTRHWAPTTPSAPRSGPCRRAYPPYRAGTTRDLTGIFGHEDLVNALGAERRGVRVGRRSATGSRVGGVKRARGFE